MNKPEFFRNELNLINNQDLSGFITKCLEEAPDYFFTMAASTTGKYHPEYCLGDGGLVRHTRAAVKIADDLLRLEMYSKLLPSHDEIVAALIMHDSVKKGINGSAYTTTDHPLQASKFIRDMADKLNYSNKDQVEFICGLIDSHMGQWNTAPRSTVEVLPKPKTLEQKFVHLCDYLASRKFLTVTLD